MGAFTPYVTLGSGNIKVGNNKTKTSAFQIGTTYDLSKRTSLYAAAGKLKLENEFKTTGYKVGLIHQF